MRPSGRTGRVAHALDAAAPLARVDLYSPDMLEPLPVLMGRRILLREIREGDAEPIFQYTRDVEVTRFLAFESPETVEETELFIARARESRLQDREYVFAVAEVTTDRPLGVTSLRHIDSLMSSAQVGTWVARPYWGQGVNGEAKRLLLDYAFGPLGLHRIEARILPENARSCRAFEKLGAVREGILRESFVKRGIYRDTYLYAILSSDWARQPRHSLIPNPRSRQDSGLYD